MTIYKNVQYQAVDNLLSLIKNNTISNIEAKINSHISKACGNLITQSYLSKSSAVSG